MMPSNHLIFCFPLLLLPLIFPRIRVFSNELALRIWLPRYWSFSISPSNEYSGLISFRNDWYPWSPCCPRTLKSFLHHHSSKASFLWCSASLSFPGGSAVKNLLAIQKPQETWVWSLGGEDPLEEGMATYSSILASGIPTDGGPGWLESIGPQRVGHDWSNLARMHSLLYGPVLTFVHDYWKNHSFDYMDVCWPSDVSTF